MSGVRNALNCSLVACRSSLRKCWHFILCYRPHILPSQDQYQILCLGLSGSGKSTLLAQLVSENTNNIQPTNGFNIKTLPLNGTVLSIKELGGSNRVQTFWGNYFENKHALLYIVDISSTEAKLKESVEILRSILQNPDLCGRPCIIIGTHNDMPGARSASQVEQYFQEIMSGRKWKLFCCSAFDRVAILDALSTLITLIQNVFP